MVDGERIRQIREMQRANGWTQARMAVIAGVSQQAAGKWFRTGKIGGASFAAVVCTDDRPGDYRSSVD